MWFLEDLHISKHLRENQDTYDEYLYDGLDENGLKRNKGKDAFTDPEPWESVDHITCPTAKKTPENGELNCENAFPVNDGSGDFIVYANTVCEIKCDKGYRSNGYDSLRCLALKNTNTLMIEGVWSEKRAVSCIPNSEYDPDSTLAPKTQTTLVSREVSITTTEATTTTIGFWVVSL